ncbi:MAG: hypothetical protein IKB47_00940 [Clostridia bacterium]|nr:hypothetical protein [Clostridia bacterium]
MNNNQKDPLSAQTHKQRPNVLLAIIFAILAIIIVYSCSAIILTLALLVVRAITSIPLFSFLTNVFSNSFLIEILYGICAYLACYTVVFVFEKAIKKKPTKNLSLMIAGIALIAINVLFLIVNLIFGASILTNIALGTAGFVLICGGMDK